MVERGLFSRKAGKKIRLEKSIDRLVEEPKFGEMKGSKMLLELECLP